jgi:hypothetical protein
MNNYDNKESYFKFTREMPKYVINIENIKWSYYDSLINNKTIIFLPSSTGSGKVYFKYLLNLKNDFRVISFDYPKYESLDKFLNDFNIFLKEINISEFFIVSYSHSGIIAQNILKEYKDKVLGMLLLHSRSKSDNLGKNVIKQHQRNLKRLIFNHKVVLKFLFRKNRLKYIEKGINSSQIEDKEFYINFYKEIFNETEIEDLNNIYLLLYDFWMNRCFSKKDFIDYNKKVIIADSKSEIEFPSSDKKAVIELFYNSKIVELNNETDLSLVSNYKQICEIINIEFK